MRFRTIISRKLLATLVCALSIWSARGQGFVNSGITFSDYLFLDVASGSNLALATTGDIYIWAPDGVLRAVSMDFRAPYMNPKVPLWADDYFNFSVTTVAPPTHFQDIVLRVSGPLGRINLEAQGGIVVDALAVPVPEPSMWCIASAGLLMAWGGNWWRRRLHPSPPEA